MQDALALAQNNLLSPMVLFFALGFLAAAAKSDLVFPEAVAKALSLYLLIAIGFKGGVIVAERGDPVHRLWHSQSDIVVTTDRRRSGRSALWFHLHRHVRRIDIGTRCPWGSNTKVTWSPSLQSWKVLPLSLH
jgi:hypothetical protein